MKQIKPLVFLPPFLLCAAFVVLQMTNEAEFIKTLTNAFNAVAGTWGWLVSLLAFGMMVLCGIIYASSFGRTVLGGPGAKKLLTTWQMFAVVLTTNIATGILFWGVYEPAWHLSHPPGGLVANSPEAAQFAISTVYLHWTFTPYAFGSIVGLMFAFAYYNMKRPFSLGAPLAPLLGRYGDGKVGQVIDAVCLYCLVAGLTSALAGSALLMGGGIHQLFHIPGNPSNLLLGGIIAAIMGTSVVAAISGITKGIRWIANANTIFLIGFLVLVLVLVPPVLSLISRLRVWASFWELIFKKSSTLGRPVRTRGPTGGLRCISPHSSRGLRLWGCFLGGLPTATPSELFFFLMCSCHRFSRASGWR